MPIDSVPQESVIYFCLLFNFFLAHLLSCFSQLSSSCSPSSTPLPSILPSCPTNMAVFGFVWRGWSLCVCVGGEEVEIITMAIHKNSPVKGKGGNAFTHFQARYYGHSRRSWKRSLIVHIRAESWLDSVKGHKSKWGWYQNLTGLKAFKTHFYTTIAPTSLAFYVN